MSFEQKQYWLKGVEYERERIIKLLEDWQDAVMGSDNPVFMVMPINVAIALIKGENK